MQSRSWVICQFCLSHFKAEQGAQAVRTARKYLDERCERSYTVSYKMKCVHGTVLARYKHR